MNTSEKIDWIIDSTISNSRVADTINGVSYFGLDKIYPCYFGMGDTINQYTELIELNLREYLSIILLKLALQDKHNEAVLDINDICEQFSLTAPTPDHNRQLKNGNEEELSEEAIKEAYIRSNFKDIFRNSKATQNTVSKYISYVPHAKKIGIKNSRVQKIKQYCCYFHNAFFQNISFDPYTLMEIQSEKQSKEHDTQDLIDSANNVCCYFNSIQNDEITLMHELYKDFLDCTDDFLSEFNTFFSDIFPKHMHSSLHDNKELFGLIEQLKLLCKKIAEKRNKITYFNAEINQLFQIASFIKKRITPNQSEKARAYIINEGIKVNYSFYIKSHEKNFPKEYEVKTFEDYSTYIKEIIEEHPNSQFAKDSEKCHFLEINATKEVKNRIIKVKVDKLYKILKKNKNIITGLLLEDYEHLKEFGNLPNPLLRFLEKFQNTMALGFDYKYNYSNEFSQMDDFDAEYIISNFLYEKIYGVNLTKEIITQVHKENDEGLITALVPLIMIPDIFSREIYLNILTDLYRLRKNKSYYSIDHTKEQNDQAIDSFYSIDSNISYEDWVNDCHKYIRHLALNYYPILEETCERYYHEINLDGIVAVKILTKYIVDIETERKQIKSKVLISKEQIDYTECYTTLKSPQYRKYLNSIYKHYFHIFYNKKACKAFEQLTTRNYLEIDELRKVADKAVQEYRRNHTIIKKNPFFKTQDPWNIDGDLSEFIRNINQIFKNL